MNLPLIPKAGLLPMGVLIVIWFNGVAAFLSWEPNFISGGQPVLCLNPTN